MGDKITHEQYEFGVRVLDMIINRECNCEKRKCAEHFNYLRELKYEFECKIMDYEDELSKSDQSGV